MRITVEHMRTVPGFGGRPGFCAAGGRRWFARHQLDWRDFVRNGVDGDVLLATGDAFAIAVVEHAMRCEEQAGG